MKRLLASIVVLLCLTSVAFAAPKKKKKVASSEGEPKVTFDVESCVDKAIDYRTLMSMNPYDNAGKCFWLGFPMVKQQMLSRSVALIGFTGGQQNIFALMDFGKESVPMGMISGLVMGMGAYEYETVSGSVNTVHHLLKLDGYLKRTKSQQKEKDILDKKVAEEQARQLEIKEAEDQKTAALAREESEKKRAEELAAWNAAEPERIKEAKRLDDLKQKEFEQEKKYQARKAEMDRLVYIDRQNGLMWTKDANISGKTMTWNDAIDWVKQLKLAGYSDWRLPTKEEIKERGFPGDYYSTGFSNIQEDYWTGSEGDAFSVWVGSNKYHRKVYEKFKYLYFNVWPVRATE